MLNLSKLINLIAKKNGRKYGWDRSWQKSYHKALSGKVEQKTNTMTKITLDRFAQFIGDHPIVKKINTLVGMGFVYDETESAEEEKELDEVNAQKELQESKWL